MKRYKEGYLPSISLRMICYGSARMNKLAQVIIAPSEDVAREILKGKMISLARWIREGQKGMPSMTEFKKAAQTAYRAGDLGGKHAYRSI